jgi:hypothetical protein
METVLKNEDAHADYILIHHAHFDHLPGAEIMAKKGAKVIANREAVQVLMNQGVSKEQVISAAGGERLELAPGLVLRTYPALHCLMPFGHHNTPQCLPTDFVYEEVASPDQSVRDITQLLTERLTRLKGAPPEVLPNDDLRTFQAYIIANWDRFSFFDGGCLAYSLEIEGEGNLFINAHPGVYSGIYQNLNPKPDFAILGVAGQPCIDGFGYTGTTADFLSKCIQELDNPKRVHWALHDPQLLEPKEVDTSGLEKAVKASSGGQVEILNLPIGGGDRPLFI